MKHLDLQVLEDPQAKLNEMHQKIRNEFHLSKPEVFDPDFEKNHELVLGKKWFIDGHFDVDMRYYFSGLKFDIVWAEELEVQLRKKNG